MGAAPGTLVGKALSSNPNLNANSQAQLTLDPTTGGAKAVLYDALGRAISLAYPLDVSLVGGADVSVADGADVTEGAIDDAAVTGDAAGTVSAKLRGLNKTAATLALDATVANPQVAPGTTAPTKVGVVAGKTNDGTPQYQPLPEGPGGRSVIVEGFVGGAAVPVSFTQQALPANQSVNEAQIGGVAPNLNAGSVDTGTQRVVQGSSPVCSEGPQSVAITSTQLLAANPKRIRAVVSMPPTAALAVYPVYLGSTDPIVVATNAGRTLPAIPGFPVVIHHNKAVMAIAVGGAQTVYVSEEAGA